jgi:hypothetical protein
MQGIDQINTAIPEMNTVTQQNAGSAEELAAIMATFIAEGSQSREGQSPGSGKNLIAPLSSLGRGHLDAFPASADGGRLFLRYALKDEWRQENLCRKMRSYFPI